MTIEVVERIKFTAEEKIVMGQMYAICNDIIEDSITAEVSDIATTIQDYIDKLREL